MQKSSTAAVGVGGLVILCGTWAGFVLYLCIGQERDSSAPAWLLMGFVTLIMLTGGVRHIITVRGVPSSLAEKISIAAKVLICGGFGVLSFSLQTRFRDSPLADAPPMLPTLNAAVGWPLFTLLVILVAGFWFAAVSATDVVQGVAGGTAAPVIGAYAVLCAVLSPGSGDVGIGAVAAAAFGAVIGFMWWNAPPSRVGLGKSGSDGIAALIVGFSVLTHTELIAVVIGAVFAMELLSVVMQRVATTVTRGRKVPFMQAPISQHFSILGWRDSTILVRYWLMAAISAAVGCGVVLNVA